MSKFLRFSVHRICLIIVMLISTVLSFGSPSHQDGLPFEPDTTEVKLNKIGAGNSLELEFILTLPSTQKLNKGAPSFLAVYEKTKGSQKWTQTQKLDLNNIFIVDDQIHLSKQIQLENSDSEVAIFSTIFHCGKLPKTACYIQGFKGTTSRKVGSSKTVPFYIEGKMK